MHLRLSENFQTEQLEDGWFGRKNLLFLSVFEGLVYNSLSSELTAKLTVCVGTIDLWRKLFNYDELTINMRQKNEKQFVEVLSRVRLGYVTSEDVTLLEKQKISIRSDTLSGRMKEVVQTLNTLPNDTVEKYCGVFLVMRYGCYLLIVQRIFVRRCQKSLKNAVTIAP